MLEELEGMLIMLIELFCFAASIILSLKHVPSGRERGPPVLSAQQAGPGRGEFHGQQDGRNGDPQGKGESFF
jgi:hypothetical protein